MFASVQSLSWISPELGLLIMAVLFTAACFLLILALTSPR